MYDLLALQWISCLVTLSLLVMAAAKVTIKPYKLKPSGDKLSRDDVTTWKEVLLSHMRQNESWRQFLPGGGNQTWTAADDGVNVWLPDTLTRAQRTEIDVSFADFLTCLSTFSPAGFGETVKRESTSFNWVIDLVHDTFGLKTRGEHFLALDEVLDPGEDSPTSSHVSPPLHDPS